MSEKMFNQMIGCFFILVSTLLYITEQVNIKLLLLAAPNLNMKVDNIFTVVLSVLFLILGIIYFLKRK